MSAQAHIMDIVADRLKKANIPSTSSWGVTRSDGVTALAVTVDNLISVTLLFHHPRYYRIEVFSISLEG